MRAYIDSDILIWHLRGLPQATELLRRVEAEAGTELWLGALQRAEVVFFMRPKEYGPTMTVLSRFKTASVTQPIVDRGAELYRRWHPSCQLDVNDAILAATVLETGGTIYTLNVKHYPMPDLAVIRGW
jgi:hypothetical protein